MTSLERGLVITDTNGNILLIDDAMHHLTRLVHTHVNIETWFLELNGFVKGGNLIEWSRHVIMQPTQSHNLRFTKTDGHEMRFMARPVKVRQLASRLNAFGDSKKLVLSWELESFWTADRSQIINWIDKMPTGAWIADLRTQRIQFVNSHLRSIVGRPDSFWEDTTPFLAKWRMILLEDDKVVLTELARRFLASNRIEASMRYRIVNARGETRHIQEHYLKVKDSVGKDIELMGITQDITEDIRVQRQLENLLTKQSELSKMRSDLIHMITHEFKSPLMVIQNSAERTMRQVDAMNQMLSNITEFAHQGAYRLESGIELVHVPALVTQVLQDTADAGGRSCRLEFQDMEMKTMTNAAALKIVLSNLVSNAYKYSMGRQAPVIQTNYSADGEWIEFAVTDYGIGIPESDRPLIFQPFRRGSNVTGLKGVGVGLSITKELVGMLRGTLDLVDLEAGMTRFLLRIPVDRM